MDESLENFLEERGIPAEKIEAMKDQKIDKDVIAEMSNEDLSKYIVKFGDRCAVRRFCTKATSTTPKAGNLKKNISATEVKEKIARAIFKR
uniref:Uncharacterized protein n=1 Tax=Magallana gigas TaxID=29159 RepID=A0A8W8JRU3_MAGGI